MTKPMVLAFVAGCSGIHSASDAPFSVGGIKSRLWAESEDDDAHQSSAVLVLSSERVDCNELEGKALAEILDGTALSGTGVLFLVSAYDPTGTVDWVGTFTDGYTSNPNVDDQSGYRSLGFAGFDDGWLYESYDETSWLTIDSIDDAHVKGSFRSAWWWGSVKADVCGSWEGTDTGVSTYTYSYTP